MEPSQGLEVGQALVALGPEPAHLGAELTRVAPTQSRKKMVLDVESEAEGEKVEKPRQSQR